MAVQYVYVMRGLTKAFPGGREVLKGITLSFLPGAKIGVLGPNGAGKTTLLRIMADLEPDFGGEAWAADGISVGYLAQEPELDPEEPREKGKLVWRLGKGRLDTIYSQRAEMIAMLKRIKLDNKNAPLTSFALLEAL